MRRLAVLGPHPPEGHSAVQAKPAFLQVSLQAQCIGRVMAWALVESGVREADGLNSRWQRHRTIKNHGLDPAGVGFLKEAPWRKLS